MGTDAADLDPLIEILDGTDVKVVRERFEVFEALHHTMRICNPMTSEQVDEMVGALELAPEQSMLDFACGYGEVLLRCQATQPLRATGIDLSPWMIETAAAEQRRRCPQARIRWVLGEARDFFGPEPADVAVCLGAEWVWHDFNGTARALAQRVRPGGIVAIGSGRLHHQADSEQVRATHGRVETTDEQRDMLLDHGLTPLHRIDPDDAGWDAYLARTKVAVERWADQHAGERAAEWRAVQREWHAARERDRGVIGWSVWIARSTASGE